MHSSSAGRAERGRFITLGLFVSGLVFCIANGISLLWALCFGMLCICGYARSKGFSGREILRLLRQGFLRISNILKIFILIGMLTGVWRLSGTIPFLIDGMLGLINPTFFVLWCFLLCAGLSSLIGTAFGTVSTLGVICMLMAHAAGFNELFVGGAVLSGVYVGDRCSPMSSSAALVCALTHTDIYGNFKRMMRTGRVPFLLTCAGYAALSLLEPAHEVDADVVSVLRENFRFDMWTLLPALAVLVLGMLRVDVKKAMAVSIVLAAGGSIFVQGASFSTLLSSMLWGYAEPSADLALLRGGGIVSMNKVIGIVAISSSYSALVEKSGLLSNFEDMISAVARRLGSFRATACVSLFATALACNQTLAIILTHQLCSHAQPNRWEMAMYLENSAVLLSAVVPWSIAFSMISLTLQQGPAIIAFALYLWIVPLYWCFEPRAKRQH